MSSPLPFLTARWRNLAMLNWVVDPALVEPLAPPGTTLDFFQDRTYVSMVGFMFLDARLRGRSIPCHRNFEEVNLRFYVKKGDRRGVAFVKELVPRAAIAWVARRLYGERYEAVPMSHAWSAADPPTVRYAWRAGAREMAIDLEPAGPFAPLAAGSEAEFIAEHYWGYATLRDGTALEYRVEHPPWRAAPSARARLDADAGLLYGDRWAGALAGSPVSAFLAEGSEVTVMEGRPL